MTKKAEPAPPESPLGTPAAPRPLVVQFGPTPSPPGSRLKTNRK
jgi:hypothetical protein